jgi:hypothetical protein
MRHVALFGRLRRCTLCSLAWYEDGGALPPLDAYRDRDTLFYFQNWNSWWSRLARRATAGAAFYFAPRTVRMYAGREGRHATQVQTAVPLLSGYAPWNGGDRIRAAIAARPAARPGPDGRLTLGIIATPAAWPDVLDLCGDMAGHAAEAVVVLDTSDAAPPAAMRRDLHAVFGDRGRVAGHPLAGDFAAQRNRIQRAARTGWVLHLDCDERLAAGARRDLSGLIDDAAREGWHAIGFTRRNLVDGVVSALYPDVQYRLIRRDVLFTRAVHEFPRTGHGRSFVSLGAGIIHRLAGERLARREAFYESIDGGAGRPHDTALLRQPLDTGIALPS